MSAQVCSATAVGARAQGKTEAQPARWGGVLAMSLCVFALIASEFMPVSLLTPMARDLALALTLVGNHVVAVAVLLGVWGLVATAAPVGCKPNISMFQCLLYH